MFIYGYVTLGNCLKLQEKLPSVTAPQGDGQSSDDLTKKNKLKFCKSCYFGMQNICKLDHMTWFGYKILVRNILSKMTS